uniref:Calcineurin-like phosphoesterase n=1 Tax=Marseillevirus LCMAC101 TaxID=2506602 RepID=A0A481YRJ3_9VIRU|nr:MAG: calcineurin-like phosphoesterase [Marseillevirus LCMAC101]
MVRLQIISDIHMENGTKLDEIIYPDPEGILIVAGDVARVENYNLYESTLKYLCSKFEKVILVPGNHEYYCIGENIKTMDLIMTTLHTFASQLGNLIVLDNDGHTVGDTIIYGSTFWSYCPSHLFPQTPIYMGPMIRKRLMTSHDFNRLHFQALIQLENMIELAEERKKKLIVVTHYAPTFNGTLHPKYAKSPNKQRYCSQNDYLLSNKVIKNWIYGHTDFNGNTGKLLTNQVVSKGAIFPFTLEI